MEEGTPPTSPAQAKPGSKDSWGPKLWQVLHNLAWVSDRTDLVFIWRKLMKSLTDVMPCPICRAHLTEYMKHNTIFGRKHIYSAKGSDIKEQIVTVLWSIHNQVNERNSKPAYSLQVLKELYTTRTRSDIISETNRIIKDINVEWEPIVQQQITGAAFRQWRTDTTLMLGLIAGGPN